MKISEIITDKYKLRIPPTVYYDLLTDVQEAEDEQKPILDRDCEHCSKTYGTLECCTTVSNKWVYSCKEGQREYLLDKIRAEIERLQKMCDENDLNLMAQYSAFGMVLDILDKYKAETEAEDGNDD